MQLTSSAFNEGETIPKKYTCQGENVSPPLIISGVPDQAKSLILVMFDPDSPSGNFIHWTMWNIPPTTTEIAEYSVPLGVTEGTTSASKPGYYGPCPGSGEHGYIFKLIALDSILELPATADNHQLQAAAKGHVLESFDLIGRYQKTIEA